MDEEEAVGGVLDDVLAQAVEHLAAAQHLPVGIVDMALRRDGEVNIPAVEIDLAEWWDTG